MASLPSYVTVLFDGYGEQFDPSVQRTDMDKGKPKQRVLNTHVMQEVEARLLFKSEADAAAFEAWYFDTIKRVGEFTFTHPRTGAAMVYSTNHTYDPHTQVCHVRIFYDDAPKRPRAFKPPPEPQQVVHLAHRQIFPEELRHLVAAAGLALDDLGGNFRGTRLGPGVDSQCGLCTKPEGHALKDMS